MYGPSTRQHALELIARGASLSLVSRDLGISRSTLRGWVHGGGSYSPALRGRTQCPREVTLDEAAYAHLLGLYLGDGCLGAHARGVFSLRISCDVRYPVLLQDCEDSMSAVLPNLVSRTTATGCVHVTAYSKHWPCLFPQHGPGRKHERPIVLEDWQRAIVEKHPHRFVRGLFHSDGCRVTNSTVRRVAGQPKRYEYPRYFFTNASSDILAITEWALDLLGVEHRRSNPRNVSVARRASVQLMDEVVGPKS